MFFIAGISDAFQHNLPVFVIIGQFYRFAKSVDMV